LPDVKRISIARSTSHVAAARLRVYPDNGGRAPRCACAYAMHELSIAMGLIDAACEEAARQGGVQVDALHLRIGALSGVVREALEFSYTLAVEGTAIAGARLEIEEVPVTVHCPRCDAQRVLASVQHFHCPVCDEPTPDVVGGRDLELFALEVSEPAAAAV
jgi:hydrogenase nickel incorporation protein HypA/HybF